MWYLPNGTANALGFSDAKTLQKFKAYSPKWNNFLQSPLFWNSEKTYFAAAKTGYKRPHVYTELSFRLPVPIPNPVTTTCHTDYTTTSLILDKPYDASSSVSRSCNCKFSAISNYKQCKLVPKLLWNVNTKSYAIYWIMSFAMTLSNP